MTDKSKIISALDEAYYQKGEPLVTDDVYDSLNPLSKLPSSSRYTIRHLHHMGSMRKVTEPSQFPCRIQPKLDGIAVEIVKDPFQVSTRGNGEMGVDITSRFRKCVEYRPTSPVEYGEITTFNKCDNARNIVTGALLGKKTTLPLIFHEHKNLSVLIATDLLSFEEIKLSIQEDSPYPVDGVVVLGTPLEAIKFQAPQAATIINDIYHSVGASGKLNPIAILEPINMMGATISKVSLGSMFKALNSGIGAVVEIVRVGEVIPKVEEIYKRGIYTVPSTCPSCDSTLKIIGANLYCQNELCQGRQSSLLARWMEILTIKGYKQAKFLTLLQTRCFHQIVLDLAKLNHKFPLRLTSEQYLKTLGAINIGNSISVEEAKLHLHNQLLFPHISILDTSSGKICFTGTPRKMGRHDIEHLATTNHFLVKSSITKDTKYLVEMDSPGASKPERAAHFAIPIITEERFYELIHE